ncbi:MAG: hypothetical protein WCK37_05325 [Candidatus Falkowbacteria bacterium]
MINIAIIENNNFYRESLKTALNQIDGFNVVFDIDNIASFLDFMEEDCFQIILIDSSNYQAESTKKMLQLYPKATILILSNYTENYFFEPQIDGISFGFIPKCSAKNVFEQKIRESLNPCTISKLQIN